jgi:hypothetical protein
MPNMSGGGGANNFKTVKCKFYADGIYYLILSFIGKICPYQNKCTFAHGEEELRAGMPVAYGYGQQYQPN